KTQGQQKDEIPHAQIISRKVWHNELAGLAGGFADCFGGEVPAADGAFHGSGPAGTSPVTSKEEILDLRTARRAQFCKAGPSRESSADFFDHVRLFELRGAYFGEELCELPERQRDDIGSRRLDQRPRRADDELHLPSFLFVEHPLDGAV